MTSTSHPTHNATTRRQITLVWNTDDVRTVRPDLTDDQAWEVLQAVEQTHDATVGVTWDTLADIADALYGDVPTFP